MKPGSFSIIKSETCSHGQLLWIESWKILERKRSSGFICYSVGLFYYGAAATLWILKHLPNSCLFCFSVLSIQLSPLWWLPQTLGIRTKVIETADNSCGLLSARRYSKALYSTYSFKSHDISVSWMVLFPPFLQVGRMRHREGEQLIQVTQESHEPWIWTEVDRLWTQTFDPYTTLCWGSLKPAPFLSWVYFYFQ